MIERLPDSERSYAVLIGTSSYLFGDLAGRPLPAVRNNLIDLLAALTDREFGGFRHDHCTVLLDQPDGNAAIRTLADNAKRATDTLLVYFAGHGLPGERGKELYLTFTDTNPDDALWWRGALAYEEIRRVLLDNCRAANRVVILDCCYSGRAIPDTAGVDITGSFDIRGTYTLAAVGDNQLAYAPPGEPHTAFTGELLVVLRDGVPEGPQLLTLNTVYLELDAALASRDLHRPRQNNNDTVSGLALTRNPAYGNNDYRKRPRLPRRSWTVHTDLSLTATLITTIAMKKVDALAFSCDGSSLAVATSTNTVRVFDTASWRQRLAVRQHWRGMASVFTVAFSPLGIEFATGGSIVDGGMVRLWYTDDGSRGRKLVHGDAVWAVAFSPNGAWLAAGDGDGTVQIWNAHTGKPMISVAHLDRVHGVAFSPDGSTFATGSIDRTARIWDAYTGEQKSLLVHQYGVYAVVFSQDGRLLATAGAPARIWDAHIGTHLFTLPPKTEPSGLLCHDVAFSPDGRFLAAAYIDHTARIWDTRTGMELLTLTHDHEVRTVAFSPDGRLLATGDGEWQAPSGRGPGTVHVWQLKEA